MLPKKSVKPKSGAKALADFNKELAKVKKEHPRLPGYYAKIVASDHVKLHPSKRD